MTDRVLNWGFLSTARINRALIPVLNASPRNRLLAVASRSNSPAELYALEWKIPRAYGSYEALLADPEIDVIYNSLPNSMHAEWTIKALQAGKHVLCEKPFALSLAEVDAMTAAANKTGRMLTEAFMYRHHPQTLKAKEIVDSGTLGRLQFIRGSFTFTLTREGNFRFQKELGGGSLWDVGCYPISYARTLVGAEPLEVFGWQVMGPGETDLTFVGQMRFEGGIHAQFDCGYTHPLRTFMEIVGSNATLNIPVPFKPGRNEIMHLIRGDSLERVKIPGQGLYSGEVEDMADAVLLDQPPHISLADSRGNIATILALYESAHTRKPVSLYNAHG